MKNKIVYILLLGATLLFAQGCDLDYENTGEIAPDDVWKEKAMITAFLDEFYSFPSRPDANADEGSNGDPTDIGDWWRGTGTVETIAGGFDYTRIDKVNFFLYQLENEVPEGVLTSTEKLQLEGQARFWRAWTYWGLVKKYGGVPLITEVQDPFGDQDKIFLPRSKTSACMTQIFEDLEFAGKNLPEKWTGDNYGRITKVIAYVQLGRVSMWYASPLFNPDNKQDRWKHAYESNKKAFDAAKAAGHDLYDDVNRIWFDENNKEAIMVHQYWYPTHCYNQSNWRPHQLSNGSWGKGLPSYRLITSFPKKDGSQLQVDGAPIDVNRLNSDPANREYCKKFLNEFLQDRDPRFYATVVIPGTDYPCADQKLFIDDFNFWDVFMDLPKGMTSMTTYQFGEGHIATSGFYQRKAMDPTVSSQNATHGNAEMDWIPMRYAELLLNYGECINNYDAAPNKSDALNFLYRIRKRAGIEAGASGTYGINAVSKSEIQDAYMEERFIELAYEGFREDDLRRWKRYDILKAQKYRQAMRIMLDEDKFNEIQGRDDFDWGTPITTPGVTDDYFHVRFVKNISQNSIPEMDVFNPNENRMFWPIEKAALDRNSKLTQNVEWGGQFNPLD